VRLWQVSQLFPEVSREIVHLTSEKRALLERLKAENKFLPHAFPPLGYTGPPTLDDRNRASAAVDGLIAGVLAFSDGPVPAKAVSDLISAAMKAVRLLDTEDRDRTAGYMLEVWYILGFKGATGRFVYGAWFKKPKGYGEPLPVGWIAPDQPRSIP
jgi:hypothetical protein